VRPIIDTREFGQLWAIFAIVLIVTGITEVVSILRGHPPCLGIVFCLVVLLIQMWFEIWAQGIYDPYTRATLLTHTTVQSLGELRRLAAFLLTTASAVIASSLWPIAAFTLSARRASGSGAAIAYARFVPMLGIGYLAIHTILFPFRFVDGLAEHGRYRESLLSEHIKLPTEIELRQKLQGYEGAYSVEPF